MMIRYNETQSGLSVLEQANIPAALVQEIFVVQSQLLAGLQQDLRLFKDEIESYLTTITVPLAQQEKTVQEQQQILQKVIRNAEVLELGNAENLSLSEYGDFVESILNNAILLTIGYSKQAISMVYRLSDVVERLNTLGRLVIDISTVNRKTKMLAFNATLEAAHAGLEGRAFHHVAAEVRDLSSSIATLSQNMQTEIHHVTEGVLETHKMLVQCAAMDMQPMAEASEKLEHLITALLTQQERFAAAKQELQQLQAPQGELPAVLPLVKKIQTFQCIMEKIQRQQGDVLEKLNNSMSIEDIQMFFTTQVDEIRALFPIDAQTTITIQHNTVE
jgi:methyl-accepting chemotaxis protein